MSLLAPEVKHLYVEQECQTSRCLRRGINHSKIRCFVCLAALCLANSAQTREHVFSHHVRATSGAFSGWHELGLALPPDAVAPQSLADILEEGRGEDKESVSRPRSWSAFCCIANLKGGADRYLTTAANKNAGHGNEGTMG